MMRCIIVDDEQHAIDIIAHYVGQTPQLELAGTTTNPMEALKMVNDLQVDLVFLDIQMPELSGIDFIKALNGKASVILTTAYSEFALESYELDVVDYLLKPIRFPRFLAAVQKAAKEKQDPPSSPKEENQNEEDFIFVKTEMKGKLLKINLSDIDYIEGMKNYVAIFCQNKKTMVYTSMKEIEEKLPARKFLRVHKSYIISIPKITGIEGNMVRLQGVQSDIMIGDSYKNELMEIIRGRMIQ
jgi:two-component system, LytTR family, response regulator